MSEVQDAVAAVAQAIMAHAGRNDLSSEDVKRLAEAAAQLKFGPQGQSTEQRTITTYDYSADIRNTSDIHNTSHDGEQRERPTAGFAGNGALVE